MNTTLILTSIVLIDGILTGFLVGCYVGRNQIQFRRGAKALGVSVGGWLVFILCMATGIKLTTLLSAEAGRIMGWGVAFISTILGFVWAFLALRKAHR